MQFGTVRKEDSGWYIVTALSVSDNDNFDKDMYLIKVHSKKLEPIILFLDLKANKVRDELFLESKILYQYIHFAILSRE